MFNAEQHPKLLQTHTTILLVMIKLKLFALEMAIYLFLHLQYLSIMEILNAQYLNIDSIQITQLLHMLLIWLHLHTYPHIQFIKLQLALIKVM
jgi:hypothetical protein